MKIEKVLSRNLSEYHTIVAGVEYKQNHAYVNAESKIVIFAGRIGTGMKTEIINYGKIDEISVAALQIIHGRIDGAKPLPLRKAMLCLLASNPTLKMGDMARLLHCSNDWIEEILQIEKLTPANSMLLANRYALARVKNPSKELCALAYDLPAHEFAPRAAQAAKDERKKS